MVGGGNSASVDAMLIDFGLFRELNYEKFQQKMQQVRVVRGAS